MIAMLWVAMGGALGALGRWSLVSWAGRSIGGGFPWGTLLVNVLGSFLLGVAAVALAGASSESDARRFLVVGVLGSFTTFSAFSFDTIALAHDGNWGHAGAYAAGSVLLSLGAVVAGAALAAVLRR